MENYFRYLSKDSNTEVWGMYIPTCGYQQVYPGDPYPLPGHPETHIFESQKGRVLKECYIIYILTGKGILETKSSIWEVNPGDVIVLAPEEWHNYKPYKNTGWEEYWIGFGGEILSSRILQDLLPDGTSYVRHLGFKDEVIFLFNQSLDLVRKNSLGFRKILTGIVIQLVAHVVSYKKQESTTRTGEITKQTINFIRKNLIIEIDFKQLANEHHLSYNRFRTIFKDETGISLQQYLIQERLESAKRLMVNTDLSLKEISAKTGFNSPFYFSKVFKNKMGYSPGKARRK
ncbi:MAG: AraC-like DNA-binding protein [Cyclobacteriaceae bacterium]|jgi:AraC-like DNA-binding protein